jgi:hypothetical protein
MPRLPSGALLSECRYVRAVLGVRLLRDYLFSRHILNSTFKVLRRAVPDFGDLGSSFTAYTGRADYSGRCAPATWPRHPVGWDPSGHAIAGWRYDK